MAVGKKMSSIHIKIYSFYSMAHF